MVRGAVLLGFLWEKNLWCSGKVWDGELQVLWNGVGNFPRGSERLRLRLMRLNSGCTGVCGETWVLWWWLKRGWGTWWTRAAWVFNTVHSFGSQSQDLDPCYNLLVIVQFWYGVEPSRILKTEPIDINQCSKAEFSLSFLTLPCANVPWRRRSLTFIWPWESVVH